MRALLISLLALTLSAADREPAIRTLVQPAIDAGEVGGLVIGVIEDGKTQVIGFGKGAGNATPDARTVYEIGSISKTFTGLLMADMVARKIVSPQDPAFKLLPSSVKIDDPGDAPIRLVDLVSQSSGLPRMPGNFKPADPKNPYADYTAAKLYEFITTIGLKKKPDAKYNYSNLGMGLLGQLLSEKAGAPYETLIKTRIAQPIGMSDTTIKLSDALKARLAPGHNGDGDAVPNWDLDALAGAGAIRSTAGDMLRYVQAYLNPPAALAPAVKIAMEPQADLVGILGKIAYAWHIKPNGIYWHNGGTAGYATYASFDPQRKTGVVVLCNYSARMTDLIGARLEQMLAGDQAAPLPIKKMVTLAPEILERYAGEYEVTPQVKFKVWRNGSALKAQLSGQEPIGVYPSSETEFFTRAVPATVVFEKDDSGAITGLILTQGPSKTRAKRIETRH
jgi:CubicO group peptidase (beta-lactamase class C family)